MWSARPASKIKEHLMKNFLAVFTGTPQARERSDWNALSESDRNERAHAGTRAWHAWMESHQTQIVFAGSPIGKTKRVSRGGITSAQNNIGGYVVVSAESHEAAARLFENHPRFSMLPGEAVEVMECMPVPGA
jgi:hypothetical protein